MMGISQQPAWRLLPHSVLIEVKTGLVVWVLDGDEILPFIKTGMTRQKGHG